MFCLLFGLGHGADGFLGLSLMGLRGLARARPGVSSPGPSPSPAPSRSDFLPWSVPESGSVGPLPLQPPIAPDPLKKVTEPDGAALPELELIVAISVTV